MSRRRLAFASIAVVVVLCLVGVSIAAVAAGGSAMAYAVNGTRVSQQTVDNQLDDLADNPNTKKQVVPSETHGAVDSKAAAQVVTLGVARQLMRDAAGKRGVTVTADDRASARESLGADAKTFPESYVDLVVDVQAHAAALGLTDNDAVNAFLARQFRRADVYVNPRYGVWNPRFGVCPPTGCAATG